MIETLPYFAGVITLLASLGFGLAVVSPLPGEKADLAEPIIPVKE